MAGSIGASSNKLSRGLMNRSVDLAHDWGIPGYLPCAENRTLGVACYNYKELLALW